MDVVQIELCIPTPMGVTLAVSLKWFTLLLEFQQCLSISERNWKCGGAQESLWWSQGVEWALGY